MKKTLLIFGIIFIVTGALSMIIGLLALVVSATIRDGSPELYRRNFTIAAIFFVVGLAVIILGIICLVSRKKM